MRTLINLKSVHANTDKPVKFYANNRKVTKEKFYTIKDGATRLVVSRPP